MVKRLFGTTIFFMFLVSLFVPRSVFALEELKLSMELWNRYTATIQNNAWTKRQFSLERGYLGLEPKLTDKISGRFTIDIYTDNKGDYKEAAGLKLKYAYLDFNGLIPIPDSKVSLGLVKHYFGFIYDWDYTTIEKSFEDVESVVKSTDYGMVLFGYLPMGLGEYALSMLNGEGYSKGGSSVNTQPSYEGNIRLIPLPGFQLGGSVLHTMDSMDPKVPKVAFSLLGRFVYGPVDLMLQGLQQEKGSSKKTISKGFMIMPVINLECLTGLDAQILARLDQWDSNVNPGAGSIHVRQIFGINYFLERDEKFGPAVWLQFNYESKETMLFSKHTPEESYMIQLRWKFGKTWTEE